MSVYCMRLDRCDILCGLIVACVYHIINDGGVKTNLSIYIFAPIVCMYYALFVMVGFKN